MRPLAALVAGWLLGGPPADPPSPRAVVEAAADAAEQGLLARFVTPWEARLRRAPGDRLALLALASAAQQRYDVVRAESLFRRVVLPGAVAGGTPSNDEAARLARLGLARSALSRGAYLPVERALRALQDDARAAADTATWIEVLVQRSVLVRRLQSAAAGEPLLDSAAAFGVDRFPRLAATMHCRRAASAGVRGDMAAMRRSADAGLAASRVAHSRRLEAACHFARATTFARASATDSMRAALLTATSLQRTSHDLVGLSAARQWEGYYLLTLGRHHEAGVALAEAWRTATVTHSAEVQGWTALSRAALARTLNDARSARRWLVTADSFMTITGDEEGRRSVGQMRTLAAFAAGDTVRGWRLADSLLAGMRMAGDAMGIRSALAMRARAAIDARDVSRARVGVQALRDYDREAKLTGFDATQRVLEGEVAFLERRWRDAEARFDDALRTIHPTQHYFRYLLHLERALARAQDARVEESARDMREAEAEFDRWRSTLSDSLLRQYATQPAPHLTRYRAQLVALYAEAGRFEDALQLAEAQQGRRLREQLAEASSWANAMPSAGSSGTTSGRRGGIPLVDSAADLATIRAAIPDARTALVEFVAGGGETPSQALVVTRNAGFGARVASMDVVAPAIQRLLATVTAGRPANGPARAVGQLVFDPLQPRLDSLGIERLVIVADDALHLLPFDLVRLRDGRAAIERFDISTMPSMTIAAALWRRTREEGDAPAGARPLLALGDPTLPRTAAGDPAEVALPALPGGRREVAAILARFPRAVARVGDGASEGWLKRAASSAGLLHLAVHGLTRAWDGRESVLALAPGGGEDGWLYAGEVAALDLRAPLVVLSACRTDASEVVGGEGVTGLTSAFLRAGARTVVTTAWALPDRGVVPLMDRFYARLATGETVGAALRAARLESLRRGDPASLWGAMRVVGDATAPARVR